MSTAEAILAPSLSPTAGHRLTELTLDFLAYLEFERGLSRNTLEAYRSDLQQFGLFLDRHGRRPAGGWTTRPRGIRRRARQRRAERACARPRPRCSARSRVCGRSTATCAVSSYSWRTRPPSCGRRARADGSRTSSAVTRSTTCWRSRAGQRCGPARPRAARDDVCLRAARVGGDRTDACATSTSRPASWSHGARESKERIVPIGSAALRSAPRVSGSRQAAPRWACATSPHVFVNQRGGGLSRQGLYKIVQRHAGTAGLDGG